MSENQAGTQQGHVFLEGEGDKWFARNRDTLFARQSFKETATIKRVLAPFSGQIREILEVGCSVGAKLADLCAAMNARGSGIDPSAAAIEEGARRWPHLSLKVGTADRLPFDDESHDLVYFGFCLYLVDRKEIYRAVAEADRVLRNGGFLAILDFDPGSRHKRAYTHKDGVFSYKTDHASFFTAAGHYYMVAKESLSHAGSGFSPDPHERVSVTVLYKEPDPYKGLSGPHA